MPACECCGTAVTLTPQEAKDCARALRWIDEFAPGNVRANMHAEALAARLEAAS